MNNQEFIREMMGDELVDKTLLMNAAADLMDGKLFFCNPDKHTDCKKTSCYRNGGDCIFTKREEVKW